MQETEIIHQQIIESKILIIRGKKVMIDRDLATLYGVTTTNLNKAVNRNIDRFPDDFMFQLTQEEFKNLIFHFGTSSWGGTRKFPIDNKSLFLLILTTVKRNKIHQLQKETYERTTYSHSIDPRSGHRNYL